MALLFDRVVVGVWPSVHSFEQLFWIFELNAHDLGPRWKIVSSKDGLGSRRRGLSPSVTNEETPFQSFLCQPTTAPPSGETEHDQDDRPHGDQDDIGEWQIQSHLLANES